ncbi:hypothetical protein ACFL5T_01810 [Gemmatimonadota bacterium]
MTTRPKDEVLDEIWELIGDMAGVGEVKIFTSPPRLAWTFMLDLDGSEAAWYTLKTLTLALSTLPEERMFVAVSCEAIYEKGGMSVALRSHDKTGMDPETALRRIDYADCLMPPRVTEDDLKEEISTDRLMPWVPGSPEQWN